ncbi:MAG: hypothetical protein GWN00_19760 [Aliifodinibius sp.]|nr:hypothetical protein [Fodinibius sp.]NIY26959.1 hypothetical protein [Fodinibius sp.]
MKNIMCLFLVILVSGCASTPEQRANRLISTYGPQCEAMGVLPESDGYSSCIINLYQARIARGANTLKAYESTYRAVTGY